MEDWKPFMVFARYRQRWWRFSREVTVEARGRIYCVVPSGDLELAQMIADALNQWATAKAKAGAEKRLEQER